MLSRFPLMWLNRSLFSAALLILTGCALGPDHQRPEVVAEPQWPEESVVFLDAGETEVRWWASMGDPLLDELVGDAIAHNHDLRIAMSNVRAARALLGEGRFDQYPSVSASGEVTRQKQASTAGLNFDRRSTLYDAGLDAFWELDFFGRVRRSVDILEAQYTGSLEQARSTLVTVTAEVARSYAELRGAQMRLAVAEENASNQARSLELTQALRDGGRGNDLDVSQATAQLRSTRAIIPGLRTEVARAARRIGVLTGRAPEQLRARLAQPKDLPELPETIRIGEPGELIRRRPDVAAVEQQLAASTAQIGVQKADLFPRVELFGSAGYFSTSADDFGTPDSERWSIGPVLSWAAFDLGRVRARIRAAEAYAEGDLAAYEQAVLRALEEAGNAMTRYEQARQREDELEIAAQASEKAAELAQLRFKSGVDSFLAVLDAERRKLEAQDALASSRTESVLALVAVYKALGGGWEDALPRQAAR
jgi:multidrug efflux system outer membrane protein